MLARVKAYRTRKLANLIGINFTYLSKLENNRADYPPREEIIKSFAEHLDLNEEELIFLTGRIPQGYAQLLKEQYQAMPVLFRRLRENPDLTQELLKQENTTK